MTDIYLSVVICSHNPRQDYFNEALASLKTQTLSPNKWELLVVDNKSHKAIKESFDLSWHHQVRFFREERLGLTPARILGIRESSGDILVFVDDDNVLEADYLERALNISTEWPILGAWGGKLKGRFELQPPEWFLTEHYEMLAVRDVQRDVWSNLGHNWETTPVGAGLVIRREVGLRYAKAAIVDPIRISLDRKGSNLVSGGDSDMVYFACDMGLGIGRFRCLCLEHLIPKERTTLEYMAQLAESMEFSNTMLFALRGLLPELDAMPNLIQRIRDRRYLRWLPPERRELVLAKRRGRAKAVETLKEHGVL